MPRIKNIQDLWGGIFFVALGVLAIWLSRNYPMGTTFQPGPGFFPTWLGGIMIAFGVVIGALAFRFEAEPGGGLTLSGWGLRPWLILPVSLGAFALLMEADFGFVPSIFVLIAGCAAAHKDVHWRETIVLSVFVTAGAVAIFIYGLGLPYRLFWWSP